MEIKEAELWWNVDGLLIDRGFTKEEAEEIVPQVRRHRRWRPSGYMSVSVGGANVLVRIFDGSSVSLPRNSRGEKFRTEDRNKIPSYYPIE